MKKKTKEIINILCYIGIFILTVIILLPPLLRFLLPDSDNFENKVTLELLSCKKIEEGTNTEKTINTHYKNGKVQKIQIVYKNVLEDSQIDEKNFYNLSGVEVEEGINSIHITIVPNNNNQERLSSLFNNSEKQKAVYEDGDYNYTCMITTDRQ